MVFSQLKTALQTELGVTSSDGMFSDTVLGYLINEGLSIATSEADWPWLSGTAYFTTESAVNIYVPPVLEGHYWVRTRALTPANQNSIPLRSLIECREVQAVSGGDPTMYCVTGDRLLLAPTPTQAVVIAHDYVSAEPELTVAGQAPLMPYQWHYIIVHAAAMLSHLRQNAGDRAEFERKQYDTWLRRMQADKKRTVASPRVRVRPGSML